MQARAQREVPQPEVAARIAAGRKQREIDPAVDALRACVIDAADDPQAKLEEIEERLNRLRSRFRTAESFWIDEVIDPRDTRRLLCDFANLAAPLREPGPSRFGMRP